MGNLGKDINYLFITAYTFPEHAGSGINAFNFANYLNENGECATVLTFNRNLYHRSVEIVLKTKIIRIPYFNKNIPFKILSVPIILTYYFINICRNKIIYIYGSKIVLYEIIIFLSWLLNKKIIFQSLLLGIDDLKTINQDGGKIRSIYRFLFCHINIYHSINPEFSKYYIEQVNKPEKILEIPQGTDILKFSPVTKAQKEILRMKLRLPPGLLLLSAGFLIRRKGYKKIFKALTSLNIPFTYIILGDYHFTNKHFLIKSGFEGDKLCKLGTEMLRENIQFRGFVSNINEYMQCADIFIHGSFQEGLPNVLLEAMATSLPVISYNIPGLKDFILFNSQNCLIYNNEDELVPLIKMITQDKSLANSLGVNANRFITQNCSFDKVTSAIINRLDSNNESGS